jgi:hypothetical protein
MRVFLALNLALALACGCFASFAVAGQNVVPPGHSAASQYTETLPTAEGEAPTAPSHPGSAGGAGSSGNGGASSGGEGSASEAPTPAQVLGAKNARRLEKAGPAGKAAAELAASAGRAGTANAASRASGHPEGSSPVKQVVGQLTGTSGSEGIGMLLPLLIVLTAVLALSFAVVRRRTPNPHD